MRRKLGLCVECKNVKPIHAHSSCTACYVRMARMKDMEDHEPSMLEIEMLIAKMLPTMPRNEEEPWQTKPDRKFGIYRPYDVSPHGNKCPLLPLLLDPSVRFTVALMKADKWLRSKECEELEPIRMKAKAINGGDEVLLTINTGAKRIVLTFDSCWKSKPSQREVQRKMIWRSLGKVAVK